MVATIEVCLNPFWNYVAVPYSLAILSFGIYNLFNLSSAQLTGNKLASSIKDVFTANLVSKENLQAAQGKQAVAVRGAVDKGRQRFETVRQGTARAAQAIGQGTRRAGQGLGAAARMAYGKIGNTFGKATTQRQARPGSVAASM